MRDQLDPEHPELPLRLDLIKGRNVLLSSVNFLTRLCSVILLIFSFSLEFRRMEHWMFIALGVGKRIGVLDATAQIRD